MTRFTDLEALQVGVFSAGTFVIGGNNYIVTPPTSGDVGRRFDIAHELSHIILQHELSDIREVAGLQYRSCSPEEDEQANALAGTLLLPKRLLTALIDNGVNTPEQIARSQFVPLELARARLKTTGMLRELSH
jgi:Zn-dependent peptidase ImmA (M78 family)